MAVHPDPGPTAYWYTDDAVVGLLEAVRRFRRADEEMRRRMSGSMGMNASDMRALQYVIRAERHGDPATPRALARHLGVSTASTTKLLDRLTASCHLERSPHPGDRRSLVVHATPHAHREIRARLARMHERMAQVALAVPEPCREAVTEFLVSMAEELDRAAPPAPLTSTDARPHADAPARGAVAGPTIAAGG